MALSPTLWYFYPSVSGFLLLECKAVAGVPWDVRAQDLPSSGHSIFFRLTHGAVGMVGNLIIPQTSSQSRPTLEFSDPLVFWGQDKTKSYQLCYSVPGGKRLPVTNAYILLPSILDYKTKF